MTRSLATRWILGGALAIGVMAIPVASAVAQGWWPWASPERPPARERPPPLAPMPTMPSPFPSAPPTARAPGNICLQLEQQLAQESSRGTTSRDALPKLEQDLRTTERAMQTASAQLDRLDCYESFLFSKTLRRSRQCIDLNNQVETARRRMSEIDAQRQQFLGSRGRSYQDDIIRELARNNCGDQYRQHAAARPTSPWSSFWEGGDTGDARPSGPVGTLPFATYRTLCVRLCDGYYFPISFSTMQNHFQRDADQCQRQCPGTQVDLYYHQNPGGSVEQATSAVSQQPYMSLKTAFRYRKEYVGSCSCKLSDTAALAPKGEPASPAPPPAPPPAASPWAPRR